MNSWHATAMLGNPKLEVLFWGSLAPTFFGFGHEEEHDTHDVAGTSCSTCARAEARFWEAVQKGLP